MPQPIFTPQGDDRNDYITIDGCIDWAMIPAHTLPRQKYDMPIRVRVGDELFGVKHILMRHGQWLEKLRRTPCELIWEKLSLSSGSFYRGNKPSKINIYVRLAPECFLVMEPQNDSTKRFYSVVSLYKRSPRSDEKPIGLYQSIFANPKASKALRKG
ncbi:MULTISPECIES: hypothetical protein [Enterobacterales]|uniref:hypothetical protein n=1 Tax=Enterobacterales TaxID=91347 RepID=UPI0011C49820|nr:MULTISPECIES: hypothetical protein [Enterobacterales]MDM2724197.1 hypothetical protein [Citrobacter sp. Cy230]